MFQVGHFCGMWVFRPGRDRLAVAAEGGFTLIEVMVAVLILALAYVSILQNFSLSLKNISRIEAKRQDIFKKQLAFQEAVANIDELTGESELQSEVFLEGSSFKLLQLFDEDREFTTLVLAPLN